MAWRTLTDSRILITGASSGIGRELALNLAGQCARLWLVARRTEFLEDSASACRALGAEVHVTPGDVTDPGVRAAIVETVRQQWGALDVLVNNAGVSAHGRFESSDETTLRRIMEVNFFAATELTRLALPLLKQGNRPAIVNIGSVLGHCGTPFNSEYSASKFALRGWTEALRAELTVDGIDVLLASPGTVETEFFDHLVAKHQDMPWGEAKGIPAGVAAKQIVRAMKRGRREIYPNSRAWLLAWMKRMSPSAVDRMMKAIVRRGQQRSRRS